MMIRFEPDPSKQPVDAKKDIPKKDAVAATTHTVTDDDQQASAATPKTARKSTGAARKTATATGT